MLKILVGSNTFSYEEFQYSQTQLINFQQGPDTWKQTLKKPVTIENVLQMFALARCWIVPADWSRG